MKNLDLNIKVLNQAVVNELSFVENEIERYEGYWNVPIELDELKAVRNSLELAMLIDFLIIFPHRRESMSLKYIGKQLGISVDALFVWFNFEGITIVTKKHGNYVSCKNFMGFMKRISRKDYRMR